MPRPVEDRRKKGYESDIKWLGRLRMAIILDARIPNEDHKRLSDCIETLTDALRPLAKPERRPKAR